MTWRARWRPAGALLAVAAVLTAVPAAGAPAPSRERAVIGAGALSVQIDDLEPAIPEPGDVLVVRGTVTNTSDAPVRSVSAGLRLSPTPIGNRAEIPEVLSGSGQRIGLAVPGSTVPVADELAPGATQTFTLRTDVTDLGLTDPGAYVTGAEAVGDSGAGVVGQDMDRTFLPWWPAGTTVEPLLLTTIWPLSGPPLRDAQGILLTEDAAVQMSPSGRLTRLLDAAAADPGSVSLIVDPEAIEAAGDLADGYRVRTPEGTVEPGTRSQEVGVWLADLTAALTAPGVDAAGGLYAFLDVDAARRGRVLRSALSQRPAIDRGTAEILGRALPSTVVLAPGGVIRPRTLDTLSARGVRAVVLSDTAAPLAEPTYFTPSGNVLIPTRAGDIPGLLIDSRIAATLALPMDTSAEQNAVRQALLAQTIVTAGELPESQQLVVAGLNPEWNPPPGAAQMVRAALTGAPWVQPTPLGTALAREPSSLARVAVAPSPELVAQELPASHVAEVRSQYGDVRNYAAIVPDPASIPQVTQTAPTRLLGSWFRDHPAPRTALTALVDRQTEALIKSVRVVSSGSITISGASGTIPITVENDGPTDVTIGLELTSTPAQLFTADPIEPFVIAPERRASVDVTAQVAAAGPIPVTIQMVTQEGEPFGIPGELVVESAAYANAARVLVRVALGGLLLAVLVHGIRRARRRRSVPRAPQEAELRSATPRDPSAGGTPAKPAARATRD